MAVEPLLTGSAAPNFLVSEAEYSRLVVRSPDRSSRLRKLREATVLEHMEAENAHDFDRCIAVFSHPRYEIIPTGEVWDGHSGVNALLQENKKGFPDFRFHPESFHHSDEAVIVEGRFTGTHSGNWRGLPPTARKVDF